MLLLLFLIHHVVKSTTLCHRFVSFLFLDSAPKHRANSMKKWFAVKQLNMTAQTPDLNPIQHLWGQCNTSCEPGCFVKHLVWLSSRKSLQAGSKSKRMKVLYACKGHVVLRKGDVCASVRTSTTSYDTEPKYVITN